MTVFKQTPPHHQPSLEDGQTIKKESFSGMHLVWVEDENGEEWVTTKLKGHTTIQAKTVPRLVERYGQVLQTMEDED